MNYCCENCGWAEIIGSQIICRYTECRTWRDECCEAWKPQEETHEKDMDGIILALEQANATINYLNKEKENAIREIEERKAFNLKCDVKPEWLKKGIDIGLNTALDILKGRNDKLDD